MSRYLALRVCSDSRDFRRGCRLADGMRRLAAVCLLAFLSVSLSTHGNAGIRGPGKYSGVVIFDRWGGCILFSGVYLMYISETVKDQLLQYDGQAIEIDALELIQPDNPGDGLIRRLKVLGPAQTKQKWFITVQGTKLDAQPIAVDDSHATIELTITNEGNTRARIDSAQIGIALLSRKIEGVPTPSDGPSTAVITRANVFFGRGTWTLELNGTTYSYSYGVVEGTRFSQIFELAPHESKATRITFKLPHGHYQFFAGYGGGVHESTLIISNPVSLDLGPQASNPN